MQEQKDSFAVLTHPARKETGPLSPGHCSFLLGPGTDVGAAVGGCGVVCTVYPGSNGMALAGHLGEILPGVPRTLFPHRVDASCLPSRRSFSCLGTEQARYRPRELSPPLAAARLVAALSSRNNNIILYYPRGHQHREDINTAKSITPRGQ